MDKQEKIVCAAMFVKWKYKDIDFKNEEIICGVDHNLIRKSSHFMDRRYNYDREYFSFEKGFITSKNRFVDAKEAMRIAIDAKQMIDIDSVISDINLEIDAIEFLIKNNDIDEKFSTKKLESLRRKLTRFLKIENRDELKPEDLY